MPSKLGLVVTPKRGRAILWPSVTSNSFLAPEEKTHHEALPVVKGIKYAANLWMHLYDFIAGQSRRFIVQRVEEQNDARKGAAHGRAHRKELTH